MKKTVSITLDRERLLKLDLNAMAKFEELTGKSLFSIGEQINSATNIRALIFACLKSAKEEITLEELGELIDYHNVSILHEKLNELMAISYGNVQTDLDDKKK